jgi:uncharacterized protein (TIGR02466 family)
MSVDIKGWFSTPLATTRNQRCADLNPQLRELFLARELEPYRHAIQIPTQVGSVFESRFDLFDWPDEPIQELAEFVHEALSGVIASINAYTPAQMEGFNIFYESWFHITRQGGYQSIHYHPNATWSGIYCVDAGDPVPGRDESAQVKFYDPRGPMTQMHFDASNRQLDPRFGSIPIYLSHQPGQLVMFPAWLLHEVLPYLGQRERIVVAFNAWLEDIPAPGAAHSR